MPLEISFLRAFGSDWANITVPHKETAFRASDELMSLPKRLGL